MKFKIRLLLAFSAGTFFTTAVPALAQGTAFTYQGRLNDGPNPANGSYDLRFIVFDASAGGSELGPIVTNAATGVSNGLFTVTLDFGSVFNGNPRYLEIAVRTNNGGGFNTLSPRQLLTPSPYAMTATSASNLLGTLPSGSLSGTYGTPVTISNAANNFGGNGAGLANVNALTLGGLSVAGFWKTAGNAGTLPGANFVGTSDNQPLELKVNSIRALRLEPTVDDPNHSNIVNVVNGSSANFVSNGVYGATIAGGGASRYFGNGYSNTVYADFGTVGGGDYNTCSGFAATVGGGYLGSSTGLAATVAGGYFNTSSGDYATVAGGTFNASRGAFATVGGGYQNLSTTNFATVGGGYLNSCGGQYATVGGGSNNISNGDRAIVGGGEENTSSGLDATVSGGFQNISSGVAATVSGGGGNNSTSFFSTVSGGGGNTAGGPSSTVPGGANNLAAGTYSLAAGNRAKALHQGAFVWADSQSADFSSTGVDQFLVRAQGGMGIGTAAPGSMLEVYGADTTINIRNRNDAGGGFVGDSFSTVQLGIYNPSGNPFGVVPAGGKRSFFGFSNNGVVGSLTSTFGFPSWRNVLDDGNGNLTTAGTINGSSDRNVKAGFEPVDSLAILEKVASLPITRWHYTNDIITPHLGPMAQDFYAAFHVGMDDKHIATVDEGGVALAAIQALNQKLNEKDAEIQNLEKKLNELQSVVKSLAARK